VALSRHLPNTLHQGRSLQADALFVCAENKIQRRKHMKEQTEAPQDPYADGIVHPLRDTPVDVGIAPGFPPNQDATPSTIGSADETAANGGQIGDVSTTHDDLADC
jgi:hypothetical protein